MDIFTQKKYLFLFLLVFLSLIFLLVFYLYTSNPTPKEKVVINFSPKWVNQAQFAGIFVAKDLGYYEKYGLEVNINEFKAGDSVLKDLESGASHMGLMNANELLINYSKGYDLKAIAAFYQISPYVVASLKANDITSPSQFNDKKLGIKGGAGAEAQVVFDLLLASAGVDPKQENFVSLPLGPSEKDDLTSGRADVIGFYRTRLYQFEKEGVPYNVIYPEQYGSAMYNDVLVVRSDFLDGNEQIIKSFIKATTEGWEYAFTHKESAISIVLKYVTEPSYKDVDYERYILNESEKLMLPTPDRQIGYMDLEHWSRFYESLNNRGFIQNQYDVREVFTTEFLPK